MTPFLKGKSDRKKPWIFYFAINRSKITPNLMQELLSEYGFKSKPNEKIVGDFDFAMKIRLEEHYNTSKFAKELITIYKEQIMEIKVNEIK